MTVTVIFRNFDAHTPQTFTVNAWEVHNTYNYLGLTMADGSEMQFNLQDIFSFQVSGQ